MDETKQELIILGGGRMGEALARGLLAAGWEPDDLTIVETSPKRRAELAAAYPALAITDMPVAACGAVLAVKPGHVAQAAREARDSGTTRILSIAAGITTRVIEESVRKPVAVVRAMPNTPALIGAGATAISPGSSASEEDTKWAERILSSIGVVVRVPEAQLDAVTGLSGSGPAYVFLVAEAMVEAGVLNGLSRDAAETLSFHTLAGAGKLLTDGKNGPAALGAAVTSPGSTTAAGLRELELHAVRAAFLDAVVAASTCSRELGA
jgi:pyrroline-5-carboxylate reductase